MSALVLDPKSHEEFPEAEVQAAVKKRRTAVERAEESLNKAKAKARVRVLRQALASVEQAHGLLKAAGADDIGADYGHNVIDFTDCVITAVRSAIREEVAE